MTKELKKGDKVSWSTSQGRTKGTIEKKVISTTSVKGHVAKATMSEPQFEVKSNKTGAIAVHRPDALKKI